MNVNKEGFINELSNKIHYSKDKCIIINEILESNFFISKKNRDKIIGELTLKLDINIEEAERIYDAAVMIINNEVKKNLRHPFKGKN